MTAELTRAITPGTTVVSMGQDKSMFRCEISETDIDIVKKTENDLKGFGSQNKKYALSDIMPDESSFKESNFAYYIADTAVLRNLESKISANNAFERYAKSDTLYQVMCAGSVFFTEKDFCSNAELEKIGMNIIALI